MDDLIRQLRHDIAAAESNHALWSGRRFGERADAITSLSFNVIDRIDAQLHSHSDWPELSVLRRRAKTVTSLLKESNERLLLGLRASIRAGKLTGSQLEAELLDLAGGFGSMRRPGEAGYDSLDALVAGLLLVSDAPDSATELEPGMVSYQPTPARVVLELVRRADFTQQDVFYDIGAGLGQVCILVRLLSGVRTRGFEVDPAYCGFARQCAAYLDLSDVEFVSADAREADYSQGTVFFLYTPCEGTMLQQVLDRLETASRTRRIRLFTYGPCTLDVSRQAWLRPEDEVGDRIYTLAVFTRA